MRAQTGGRDGRKQEGKETLRGKRIEKDRFCGGRCVSGTGVTTAWRTFMNCMDADFLHPRLKQHILGCKEALKRAIMLL